MLKSKRSTRPSEGKQEALDVLSADEKVRLEPGHSQNKRCVSSKCGPSRRRLLSKRHRTQISR